MTTTFIKKINKNKEDKSIINSITIEAPEGFTFEIENGTLMMVNNETSERVSLPITKKVSQKKGRKTSDKMIGLKVTKVKELKKDLTPTVNLSYRASNKDKMRTKVLKVEDTITINNTEVKVVDIDVDTELATFSVGNETITLSVKENILLSKIA